MHVDWFLLVVKKVALQMNGSLLKFGFFLLDELNSIFFTHFIKEFIDFPFVESIVPSGLFWFLFEEADIIVKIKVYFPQHIVKQFFLYKL